MKRLGLVALIALVAAVEGCGGQSQTQLENEGFHLLRMAAGDRHLAREASERAAACRTQKRRACERSQTLAARHALELAQAHVDEAKKLADKANAMD
jgi:hypothetical protein